MIQPLANLTGPRREAALAVINNAAGKNSGIVSYSSGSGVAGPGAATAPSAPAAPARYPRNLNVNFRKLNKAALTKILRHYRVTIPRKNSTQSELAIMAARVFEVTMVLEDDVVDKFANKFCHAAADALVARKKPAGANARDLLDREPAAVGEQVAARSPKSNEDESWILGNVLEYDPVKQQYKVKDEDDEQQHVMLLAFGEVRRLQDTTSHLRRGDEVLAVFPETTSFYRAVVVKTPKAPGGSSSGGAWEVVVKFEDDEDASGKSPARRVPARFVLRRSDLAGNNDDSDDADD